MSPYKSSKGAEQMEIPRLNNMKPETPKVFSDKVKEETEKIKKQMGIGGIPGNLQEQQMKIMPKKEEEKKSES